MNKLNDINNNFIVEKDYIKKLVIALLAGHFMCLPIYHVLGISVLNYYILISLVIYCLDFYLVAQKKLFIATLIALSEFFVFMSINVMYLGWGYAFHMYIFDYIILTLMIDFFVSIRKRLSKITIALEIFYVLYYIGMRLMFLERSLFETHEKIMTYVSVLNVVIVFLVAIAFVYTFRQITYNLQDKLDYLATHDALTDLYNRLEMERLSKSSHFKEAKHVRVAMLDIDYFKNVNDTYGHDVGDDVLRDIAKRLKSLKKDCNDLTIARWGGEEFLLVDCSTNINDQQFIDHLHYLVNAVDRSIVKSKDLEIHYTITCGVTLRKEDIELEALIKRADILLYEGKQSGRNKLVCRN